MPNPRDILKREYKHWPGVIFPSLDRQKFPLKLTALLGLEDECILFSEQEGQTARANNR
jgi:hypothetical protein